ncbi:D-arabinono-1,4-lactone oxidase [Gordonia hydrophobica]|uniref:D-arabinono-1,4-lactone oxidase n=1 Tax=Gordonia hydrophobica TaxID=40516 RepID=A0ABZ2U378_9ACTN|nr:D-arabinono-1,4-lactone oxidase [Gordonia hydrophobica]MBM7367469.1 FAD-linked oxidoreductase [Gordonia hydrophobica]
MSRSSAGWTNWGGTASCTPHRLSTPQSTDELAADVRAAADRGDAVKPVGAGHSFSEIAVAPNVQVDLSGLHGISDVDAARKRVTLGAGTRLHQIPALLEPLGLAMANLGDIDQQTIAGATSTGTHGTGGAFGGLSTQIRGVTLVDGTGQVRTIGENDPDLKAAALGLGALGILTDITLELVDAFAIEAVEEPGDADATIDGFLDRVATVDHYEFYWFPHTSCTLTKTNTRLPASTPASGPGAVRRYVDDELLSNSLFRLLCGLAAAQPRLVPTINQVSGRALSARTYADRSDKVFVSNRDVRFREMEYALPLDAVPDALHELRSVIDRRRHRVSFPVEVRAAAADDLLLSTASGRATGYIAVHRYHRDAVADAQGYFRDVEDIMTAHDGRPHWGKMHTRDADYLRRAYPRFDDFLAVRDRFDPERTFDNPYLRTTLGD